MSSNAFSGVGATLELGDGASSESFTAIAEVNSIDGPNISVDTIDVTSLDSTGGYREFIASFIDGGEVTAEFNFTLDGYDDLKVVLEARARRNFQIVLPDTGSTTFSFSALVTALGVSVPKDDKVTASMSLKISGQVTLAT